MAVKKSFCLGALVGFANFILYLYVLVEENTMLKRFLCISKSKLNSDSVYMAFYNSESEKMSIN